MAELYKGTSRVGLTLEAVSVDYGENVIHDTVHHAMTLAWHLNVQVSISINGCLLIIFPTDKDVEAKVDALKHAWGSGGTVIC